MHWEANTTKLGMGKLRKNWIDTIRQDLKETGMSWEEALQGAVLTDKTDVDVWSCVTLTRDIKQRPRIICMPIIMRNL